MRETDTAQPAVERRAVLKGGLLGAVGLGLGVMGLSGTVAATDGAKDAETSEEEDKRVLDVLVDTATKALEAGNDVTVAGLGTFAVARRSPRSGDYWDDDSDDDGLGDGDERAAVNVVTFSPSDALAAELDIVPGEGDVRRKRRTHRESGLVVDAALLARDSGLSKADAKRALDSFVTKTTAALKNGDRLALVGFGSFSISKRSARTGRNPQTGKEIKIAAKNVVKFKAGAELSKAVN